MKLSDLFTSVAVKKLSKVDLPDRGSNQHEIDSVSDLREFFGTAGIIKNEIQWHIFNDNKDIVSATDRITFYDARRKNPDRPPEWRMYYSEDILMNANPEDTLYLVRLNSGEIHGLVFHSGSLWLKGARILFNQLEEEIPEGFSLLPKEKLVSGDIEYVKKRILYQLGIDHIIHAPENDKDIMSERFGLTFPNTATMSRFARTQVEFDASDPNISPDRKLTGWIEREEELFRALEELLVQNKLEEGFRDVEEFISYSLSVQNRRKSRMGWAFEHHLKALFDLSALRYTWQAETERGNTADFIFPGENEYHNPEFDSYLLDMLGVKSTLKERWRQILEEADRIEEKHVCTLETGLSPSQTESIRDNSLRLVVPSEFHVTYTEEQQDDLMNLEEFLDYITSKQEGD